MFVSASTYITSGNMPSFSVISSFETLLFNAVNKGIGGEKRMFEEAMSGAVSMLVFFFGVSVAFLIFSGYLWTRTRKRMLLE
jgi:hypothetical protein